MNIRPSPYAMVFGAAAEEHFSDIRRVLEESSADPLDRDAFVLARPAAELIHRLEPDEGMGEAVGELASLVHYAFVFWLHGSWVFQLHRDALDDAPVSAKLEHDEGLVLPAAYYFHVPHRLVWGQLGKNEPFQPLDGCFVTRQGEGLGSVLGIFGFHPDRLGFSVVEAVGPWAPTNGTPRGSAPFAPRMDGGADAGLYSINDSQGLITLAARGERTVAKAYADQRDRATP